MEIPTQDIYEYSMSAHDITLEKCVKIVASIKLKDQTIVNVNTKRVDKVMMHVVLLSHVVSLYSAVGKEIGHYIPAEVKLDHTGLQIHIKYMSHILANDNDCAILIRNQLALTGRKNINIMV